MYWHSQAQDNEIMAIIIFFLDLECSVTDYGVAEQQPDLGH